MKNRSKLIILIVLILVFATGCGSKNPTTVVQEFFQTITTGDQEKSNELLTPDTKLDVDNVEEDTKLTSTMLESLKKLTANVSSETIEDETATVEVVVTGVSYSQIVTDTMQSLMTELFKSITNGEQVDDAATQAKTEQTLLEAINKAELKERTGTINLKKVEKEWKIEFSDEIKKLIMG